MLSVFPSRIPSRVTGLSMVLFAVALAACGSRTPNNDTTDNTDDVIDIDARNELTPDASVCMTLLCGNPAACCDSGDECIADQCVAACDTGIRCGEAQDICCNSGEVCLSNACVVPGEACADSYDCEPGNFCEPTLNQCLPQPNPLTCEVIPSFDEITEFVEWSYQLDPIISIPVVANLDGAGPPEVVVNLTGQNGSSTGWTVGQILVLNGANGEVVTPKIPHNPPVSYGSDGRSFIAVGDVDGDALPDIIYLSRKNVDGLTGNRMRVIATKGDGTLLWASTYNGNAHGFISDNSGVTLANFDDDPEAEILVGASLIDNDGRVLWDQGCNASGNASATASFLGNGALCGSNAASYTGGIAIAADLDGDGKPEIVTGKHAWKVTMNAGPPATAAVVPYWTYAGNDGYPAVADLDGNGTPEVVLVANGNVIMLNGQTGKLWCGVDPTDVMCVDDPALRTQAMAIPGAAANNRGGPPTVADFDNDGRPEVGVAGGYSYSVYDLNRAGEDTGTQTPAAGAIFARWSEATQDLSSNCTGSSVFDFQGDGEAEVVYADECKLRVYSGATGEVQLELPNSSATIHEFPLVVDVDGDGNSEILVVANDGGPTCGGEPLRKGLFVYGDLADRWVPTRKVWTQHSYHVTNATSAGNVPLVEDNNWMQPGLNNYRQNVQGDGVFNAPDLSVELSVGLEQCANEQLVLKARVTNRGALGVPAGVGVRFYAGSIIGGTVIGTGVTSSSLLPGQSNTVSLTVAANSATEFAVEVDGPPAIVTECVEDNNSDETTAASCGVVID